jgi:hypothetical protein
MYKYFLYISYVLFILSLLGITLFKTNYLDILNKLIKIYIAVILIIRFNPFITAKLDKQNIEFDREISFSAGILLLLSMIVTTYITQILDYVDFASDMF